MNFKSIFRVAFGISMAVSISGAVQAQTFEPAGTKVVTKDFWISDVGWSRGRGGIEYAFDFKASEDGKLVVCGAIKRIPGGNSRISMQMPGAMQLMVNNRVAVRNVAWMPILAARQDVIGATADCRKYPNTAFSDGDRYRWKWSKRQFNP